MRLLSLGDKIPDGLEAWKGKRREDGEVGAAAPAGAGPPDDGIPVSYVVGEVQEIFDPDICEVEKPWVDIV